MDTAFPADYNVELKESRRKDKFPNLAKELKKKIRNTKVTVIPIVIGTLVRKTKRLVHGQEDLKITGQMETIKTTELFRSARILKRVVASLHWSSFPSSVKYVLFTLDVLWDGRQVTMLFLWDVASSISSNPTQHTCEARIEPFLQALC